MAFIQAAKDYDICKCRREPREMISHVNDLAKEAHSTKIELMDLRDIIERKSPQFWGMPFVRIKQDDGGIKTLLGGSEVSDTPSFTTRNYYMEVRNNSQKIDIFEGLLSDLDPEFVIVLASDVSAAEVVATLEGLRPCSIWESGAMVTRCSTSDHRAYVLVNHNGCIPAFTGSKCLIVAYDSPPDSIQYDNNQDSSGVMSVEFVEPGSKPHLHPDTAKEVDPFLSGFFHHPAQWGNPNGIKCVKETLPVLNYTKPLDLNHDMRMYDLGKLLTPEQKAEPPKYADCIHWCLPGVPDVWNQILYTRILSKSSPSSPHPSLPPQ
uniref:Trichome birefringence-like C-terminal domain-containing protein n=1 Tax=Oryza punctata TaxID=4537 RepID=A0A0E0MBK9_ORYPU